MTYQQGSGDTGFESFFVRATGFEPYRYQGSLAEEGLPEVLEVPTGAGKTQAIIVAWLWRLTADPDPGVRLRTPPRLIYVLPMRVLVEQTVHVAKTVIGRAGLADEVGVYSIMGGEGRLANAWRDRPEQPAILVGTQDMLLSRALNRSYGQSRFVAPIDFGIFNNGAHWVYDEVQLMGASLPTSRQLEGLRRRLGTVIPCSSTWMSATIDARSLCTIDLPQVGTAVSLTEEDHRGPLSTRLAASKTVSRLPPQAGDYVHALAAGLLEHHRAGTRTIAVLNTVGRATQVYRALRGLVAAEGPVITLLHSRFRPPERAQRLDAVLRDPDPQGGGTIVITTQVLEAGVDVTSTTLFTEAAPWSSVVQRAGRCNRDGLAEDARLLWAEPPQPAPYEPSDVAAAAEALAGLEGQEATSGTLVGLEVDQSREVHAVLRRRDLLELFDNAPDLSGNEVDVGRFIRDVDELDVQVAWRPLDGRPGSDVPPPTRDELCPAPVSEVRKLVRGRGGRAVWRFDVQAAAWRRPEPEEIRPGNLLLLDASQGGYLVEEGWAPTSRTPVDPVPPVEPDPQARPDEAVGSDHPTWASGRWVPLIEHLEDTERACAELLDAMAPAPDLASEHLDAARVAARLHDIGKVHPVFQETMRASAGEVGPPGDGPWAKSGGGRKPSHSRPHFRHELVTALLLLDGGAHLLDEVDESARDLAIYLAAAHHGKVRLAVRSLPDEKRPDDPDARFALGVWEGDATPAADVPGGHIAAATLRLDTLALGLSPDGRRSWVATALALRDDPQLGPFRLGFLEAVVRLADWRASAKADRDHG